MTNVIFSAMLVSTLTTNWITVGDKEVGVLIEKRVTVIDGEQINLKDKIINQPLVRNKEEMNITNIYTFGTNWPPRWYYWTPTNLIYTNYNFQVQ